MAYASEPIPAEDIRKQLGDIFHTNPEVIEGYLAVGVRIDGALYVTHNTCCLAHFINELIRLMAIDPSLNQVNPSLKGRCEE